MLFLTHMLNRPVLDADGVRLGWVEDLVLSSPELFPRVEAIVLARRGCGAVFVPWSAVRRITAHTLRLACPRADLPTSPLRDDATFLRRDILDKQIVDIHGRKVVRVNDLQLAPIEQDLRLVGADIGAAGLLRRLSLERPVRALAGALRTTLPAQVIPWNYVEGLETEWPSVRLNVSHRRLRELPPTDFADILTQLHPVERDELLTAMDDETVAETLPHLEDDMQAEVIMAMSDERASDILEILPPDEAADVLGDLSEERAERLLHLMEPDEAEDVRELMQYADDTAGGRMTTDYYAFTDDTIVDTVMAELRKHPPDEEMTYYLYTIDAQGRLDGVLSLRDLITADGATPLREIARRAVLSVNVRDDQETVATELNHYHFLAVPVVDDAGLLRGVVTVDDVLDVMHEEAEEDLSRLSGATEESDVFASPWEQLQVRLPWLLAAALGGIIAALYLVHDEVTALTPTLTALLTLLPVLLLLGAQLGGQGAVTAQVGIRQEETTAEILWRLLRYQWTAGFALSTGAALIAALFVGLIHRTGPAVLAGAILWGVLLVVMLTGSLLPLLLHRLRLDPLLINRPTLAVLALLLGIPLLTRVL